MTAAPIETVSQAYNAAVDAMIDLTVAISAAQSIRYAEPPGFHAVPNGDGVVNPTLDMVVDPRRVELNRVLWETGCELTRYTRRLEELTRELSRATEEWGGGA